MSSYHFCSRDDFFISAASAPVEVISLENTLNGTIFPQDEIIRISEFARKNNLKMHLDGARIWHVAAETGISIKELCDPFDTVSLCFSKGLGTCVFSRFYCHTHASFAQVRRSARASSAPRTSSSGRGGSASCSVAACARLVSSPRPRRTP